MKLTQPAQVDALQSNLKRAEPIISSCPACKENFFNLFCTFTCSPDQSLFVNVTDTTTSTSKKLIVTELDNYWSNAYASGFYDSCKDVKFGATGGKAMDFIGGGAKNYSDFLAFLGEKKLLGSPFQINFPRPNTTTLDDIQAMDPTSRSCNSSDEAYRCACVDCPAACPTLPRVEEQGSCHVGALPCLSFSVIIIYSVFLLLLVTAVSGHVAYQKHNQRRSERLQLLQDAAVSDDDEDDHYLVRNPGVLERSQRQYKINTACDRFFNVLGRRCARFPVLTIFISILAVVLLSLGWTRFDIETNPVRLWVSPTSAAAKEKVYFDENFGPFFRAEQVFLVNDTAPSGPGPILSYTNLAWWFDVESRVQRIMSADYGATLKDVCFNPTGEACVVQSITGYFGGSFSSVTPDGWKERISKCTASPGDQQCLPDFQQPLRPDMILGGMIDDEPLTSRALIVTWVVNNFAEGSIEEKRAIDWEQSLKNTLLDAQQEARQRGLRLSLTTEMSLEQELNQTTNTDAKIVVVSYIIMFLYASLALGSVTLSIKSILKNPRIMLVQSKFSLGVVGILIVLMSVSASIGLFSAVGFKVTLIIAEVIPFLVLAVGVDNIFLIVHEFERVNISYADDEIEVRIAKALGRMGPSILLSALIETVAFALGAAVGMPAVKNFAVYAAGAVFINAILQVTMFVSVLALNQRRVESNRIDCFPFIKLKHSTAKDGQSHGILYGHEEEGQLQKFIRKVYAPTLLDRRVKVGIIVGFLGLFTAGLALIPKVALGLDQRIAFPQGSYLIDYFNDLDAYFNTGPPVYFVVPDLNVTQRSHQQELCARYSICHPLSLASTLELESQRSDISYLTGATASWLDDFIAWGKICCTEETGESCFTDRAIPQGPEFITYLSQWLASPTNEECPFGGKAPYSNALVIDKDHTAVPASHFRTSHTPLRSQADFIAAYASARRISQEIKDSQGIEVFPYSKFYIFFEQYSSIVRLTATLICCALVIILLLSSLLLGSLATGAIVTFVVAMIVTDILGCMALFHISLNAISLVNLVICVGIGVEFCAHVARAFMFPARNIAEQATKRGYRSRDARAWGSLVNVGASVFSGITITKFLGVVVLAFTRSKIFEVYYFRIWICLVVLASLHALVLLPVALSLGGGEGTSLFFFFFFFSF